MTSLHDLLVDAATRAAAHRDQAAELPVFPADVDLEDLRRRLEPLPDGPTPAATVVSELADAVEPALVATSGPRYFGFVVGGALDAATAADVLTVGWDQPAFNPLTSPGAAVVEDVAGAWLKDLLGLPAGASVGLRDRRPGGQHRGARRRPAPRPRGRRAGTSSGAGSPAVPRCGWWPTASGTPRSTAPCACSGSGPT